MIGIGVYGETYPLLRQLPRPLILTIPQQLNHPSLIRRQPSHLLHNLSHERRALAQVALRARDARFADEGGGFLQCNATVSRMRVNANAPRAELRALRVWREW